MNQNSDIAAPQFTTPTEVLVMQHLVRVASIHEFIDPVKQSRILMTPYWVRMDSGVMWFEFISTRTDSKKLNQLIKEGCIYKLHATKPIQKKERHQYPDPKPQTKIKE